MQGEGDIMSCAPTATANATSVATMNADSTLRPEFEVRESDVCSYVIDDLPYGCSCENNGKVKKPHQPRLAVGWPHHDLTPDIALYPPPVLGYSMVG